MNMANSLSQVINNCSMLNQLRTNKNKYLNAKESKNLFAIHEQHIFVWHDCSSCILTSELSYSEKRLHENKVLSLTNPPVFDVGSMIFNHTGSLLALSGKNGVMVYEVPWRYGKFGVLGCDKETIIGRSWNIAESFFVCSSRIGVIQVAWHPGSASSTHLTILSTDNYIRIYDVTDPQTPLQVISLGNTATNTFLHSESKIDFSTCFGENAIGFDFGQPEEICVPQLNRLKQVKSFNEITVWPIYLLRSNGDVYVVKVPIKREKFQSAPKVIGPLAMYPPSEDNYGYDACSILYLNTTPPCVVIATSTGIIYHCIVLENLDSNKNFKPGNYDFELEETSDPSLYVFESVELMLTLSDEQDDAYSHPIKLYKDITSQNKYHCTHISGLHSVAIPFLKVLEENVETGRLEKLLSLESKQACIVEHLLCTKPLAQMECVPVLGLDVTISDVGVTMICLLASWEFVCFSLVSSYFSSASRLLSEKAMNLKNEVSCVSPTFEEHIEKALSRSVTCPYLKSHGLSEESGTSHQQWLDLLCNITQRFREDYIQKLNTAQALLRSRIKVLIQQKEYQLRDITRCQEEKEKLKSGAERLAEKYEEANSKQQKLLKRIEIILQKLPRNSSHLTKAETDMKQTLMSYEEKLKEFDDSLNLINKKIQHQTDKIQETNHSTPTTQSIANLTEVQTKRIKELLAKEGESIGELIKTMNSVKKTTTV